uniref:C-type lectin domain-containing protein n=1 Tax=Periophthalmus magnuspinnatus TaxID=409849 RepID=A0A3B3ZX14_9GOBI
VFFLVMTSSWQRGVSCLKRACVGLCLADDCCPDGWSHFGSRCFMFFRKPKTWIDAELSCIEIGGNLASIHSSDDNQFIQDTVLRLTGSHWRVWIGGHDGVEEGVWQWTDGSPFDFNHWNYGEPNNFRGEHCLVMNWGAHLWSDYRCTYRLPYMCSKPTIVMEIEKNINEKFFPIF